ncbi:MAG TPA: ABC transporter permease [Thermoanaerobaculia bacterium]
MNPLYWSVRRELWENRSIYIVPLAVAALALFGTLINTMLKLPRTIQTLSALEPARQRVVVAIPYSMIASVVMLTGFVVGIFYCLDALNGERRDRSLLFWKSLPVSDRTTVLAKALVPLAVIPVFGYVIILIAQLILFLMSNVVLAGRGVNPAPLWLKLPFVQMSLVMLYGLTVHVLWFSPIYGWLLMVSAWARRATFLWAFVPFFAIVVTERMAFGSSRFGHFLRYRVLGAMSEAFEVNATRGPITRLTQLTPLNFLTSPGLWLGLIFAAAFIAAAVRLRRNREPN